MNSVFCYSGTGNSLASAKQLAALLDMQVVHITDELAQSKSNFKGDVAIVVFPVYAYGMPKTVKRFIKGNNFEYKYLAVLVTMGSSAGGTYAEAIKLFRRKKQRVAYTKGIAAVENYVHMFKLPSEEDIKTITVKQINVTEAVAEEIKNRKTNKRFGFRPGSVFISFIFRRAIRLFVRRYKVTTECTGCGICHKICPAGAITMTESEGRTMPAFSKKCDHCQGCLQLCPKKALHFGRIKPESRRYRHSDINIDEMVKR